MMLDLYVIKHWWDVSLRLLFKAGIAHEVYLMLGEALCPESSIDRMSPLGMYKKQKISVYT